jgi:hypothetical protein
MADQRSQREDAGVSSNPNDHESLADSLADWRSAERDTVAARSAARVAELALAAAVAAEEAAVEVEAAAASASEAVSRARSAAVRARQAAAQAAEAANLSLTGAQGDKARANHDVEVAEQAEETARDRFHDAERDARHERGSS